MTMDHDFKNILHNVNLTEGQIGVILCSLEEKQKNLNFTEADFQTNADIQAIYKELEGSVDRFYDNMERKQKQQPIAEWTD